MMQGVLWFVGLRLRNCGTSNATTEGRYRAYEEQHQSFEVRDLHSGSSRSTQSRCIAFGGPRVIHRWVLLDIATTPSPRASHILSWSSKQHGAPLHAQRSSGRHERRRRGRRRG
ncbi:unnamed protein product [Pylaiella littoralis]